MLARGLSSPVLSIVLNQSNRIHLSKLNKMVDIQTTSNAAWWIKKPAKTIAPIADRKKSMSTSFCQDLSILFRNISLHGYSHLFESDFNIWEKFIWLCVHTTTLFILIVTLCLTWEQFVSQYIVIHLHDPIYSVRYVPFPAVSICSNNRISQQAALEYAKSLRQKDPLKRKISFYMKRILSFTDMYYKNEVTVVDEDDLAEFQSFLDTYDTLENETFFNTRNIISKLTPRCDHIIKICMLADVEVKCFSNKTFQESLTVYGPCCTFNTLDSYHHRNMKNLYAQPNLGLTVILNISHADTTMNILNIDGFIVIIHAPDEFPDIASGASQEVFPTRGEESFLSIRARIIDTEDVLIDFHPKSRKCYFDHESPSAELLLHTGYSFTNCITRCRIRSIMALCNCLPFYMPIDLVATSKNIVYCTLQHISCLTRYNYKWRNVLTERRIVPGLEREMEEALYCPQCLPSCNDVQYQASLMSLPIDRFLENIKKKKLNLSEVSEEDTSVLRVYFGEQHAEYYKRLVDNTWFEALSMNILQKCIESVEIDGNILGTVGNLTSIFVGFSMVAILEIMYLLIKYISLIIKKNIFDNLRNDEDTTGTENTQLYICP